MEPRTITVEGLRVRVVIEDRGGARDPVVLIHGVGGWAETWRPVVAPLAAAGHLVVALDLPGFGQSQAPGRVSYFGPDASFSEFIRAISAGVNIRGVRRPLREAWVARASRYGGPTLAVWGREDYVLPVKHLRDVQRILPQAQAHVIERCGHLAMFERPDEFLAATVPFLD